MRTSRTTTVVSYLALSFVSVGLFVSSAAVALPTQSGLPTAGKTTKEPTLLTKAETKGSAKNPVLVRSTTPAEPGPKTTSTSSIAKTEDKKAISRCWKRLMNMVREVNHAHRVKNNKA